MPAKIRLLIDAPRLCAIALVAFVISRLRFGSSKHIEEPGETRIDHCRGLARNGIQPERASGTGGFHGSRPRTRAACMAANRRGSAAIRSVSATTASANMKLERSAPPGAHGRAAPDLVDEAVRIAGKRHHQCRISQ